MIQCAWRHSAVRHTLSATTFPRRCGRTTMRSTRAALAAAGLGLALTLAACGQNAAAPSASGGGSSAPAATGAKVGVILPGHQVVGPVGGVRPAAAHARRSRPPAAGRHPERPGRRAQVRDHRRRHDHRAASKVLIIVTSTQRVGRRDRSRRPRRRASRRSTTTGSPWAAARDYYVSFDNVKVGALQGQGLVDALSASRRDEGRS